MGLFDMVMIKDNHISTAGGVTNALRAVDQYLEQKHLQMEVEVVLSLFYTFLFRFHFAVLLAFAQLWKF